MYSRKLQALDNLDSTAQRLIDFIMDSHIHPYEQEAHKRQLIFILNDVKRDYKGGNFYFRPLKAIEKKVHSFTRQRSIEIDEAINMLESTNADDQLFLLDIIAGLLKQGNCEPTSANTKLLTLLMSQLKEYAALDEDENIKNQGSYKYVATKLVIEKLRELFVKKAEKTISEYLQEIERIQAIYRVEKPEVRKLVVSEEIREKIEGVYKMKGTIKASKRHHNKSAEHSVKGQYSPVMNMLESLMQAKMEKEAADKTSATRSTRNVEAAKFTAMDESGRAQRFADARARVGKMFHATNVPQVQEEQKQAVELTKASLG